MRRSHVPRQIARTMTVLALYLAACTEQPSKQTTDQAVASWSLIEDLRIGGADSGPASFSKVHSVVESPNGNVFVLELQDQELRVFDNQGTFLHVAARRGAGPGELEYATGMALGPDAVVVNDPSQGRYTLVDFNGRFLRHTLAASSGYGDVWKGAVDSLGRIIHPDGRADTVGGVTCGAPAPTHVYRTPQGFITSYTVLFTADPQTVVTARGTVWCAPMSTYQLLQAPLGQPLRTVVSQQVPLVSVPPTLRDSLERRYRAFANKTGTLIDDGGYRIPTTYPALQQIDVDDNGRVWVRRNSETTPALIDVFDATGMHIASVRVPRALGDRLFIARQHLYDIQLDGDDVPVVVRYRIDRQ